MWKMSTRAISISFIFKTLIRAHEESIDLFGVFLLLHDTTYEHDAKFAPRLLLIGPLCNLNAVYVDLLIMNFF